MKRIKIKDHSFIRPAKSDYFFDYLPTHSPPLPIRKTEQQIYYLKTIEMCGVVSNSFLWSDISSISIPSLNTSGKIILKSKFIRCSVKCISIEEENYQPEAVITNSLKFLKQKLLNYFFYILSVAQRTPSLNFKNGSSFSLNPIA